MCENDGTDSVCMKHAGHASACLNNQIVSLTIIQVNATVFLETIVYRKHFLRRRYRAVMDKRIVQTRLRAIQNVSR